MTGSMSHAAAREAMAALLAVPAERETAVDADVRAAMDVHIAACPDCAGEYQALRATAAALQLAVGPSPQMRGRVLETVAKTGRPRGQSVASRPPAAPRGKQGRLVPFPRAWAAAAVLALLAFVGGAVSAVYLAPRQDEGAMSRAAMVLAEMARDPSARAMTLEDPSGAPAGTLMYQLDTTMLVVFSEALEEPASGRYGCYLERDGERTWIGPMHFDSGTAFWAGPVRTPGLGEPGARFLVLAGPDDPTPMLEGTF